VDDVEFRLGRGYRTRPLALGCLALVVAAALYAAGLHMPTLQWLAVVPLAYAAGSFAVWAWRGHVSTRLTARGIEIRRFRRRLVPWQAIRGIETISSDHVADVPVVNIRIRDGSSPAAGVRGPWRRCGLCAPAATGYSCPPRWSPAPRTTRTSMTRWS
jgi:hypothetical protein